jgi:cytochrome c oxidase subunit 2
VPHLVAQLWATNWGSPGGITKQDSQVRLLWSLSFWLAIPLGLIVTGLVLWCVVRYRARPGHDRTPRQIQYHIPLEITYTIVPLLMVATIFGFAYHAENVVDHVAKSPPVRIRVEGFQWGWRFTYLTVNGHPLSTSQQFQEVGSVANEPSINDTSDLPILTVPTNETVEFDIYSDDVDHLFYIPAALFQRDMIQGISNTVNMDFVKTGHYIGECTQYCGPYHPYMRFMVDVMPAGQFNSWARQHKPGITYAGHTSGAGIPPDLFGRGQ